MKNEQCEPTKGNVQSKRPDAEHIDWSLRYHELVLAIINSGSSVVKAHSDATLLLEHENFFGRLKLFH